MPTERPLSTPTETHRCQYCGALVHPANSTVPVAWCDRCHLFVPATKDGPTRGNNVPASAVTVD
ncbi:MAG: hypothetical protein ACYCV7_12210 [Acidimicrobiales bacterium]